MSTLLLFALVGADFPICTAASYQAYPSVCYANDRFYVFWVDQRQTSPKQMAIYGARVTKSGTVLDPDGRELYKDSAGYRCSAAWDGTNFLIVTRNHC